MLDEIPLFARTGAVIPMAEPATRVGDGNSGPRVVTVFPGADGRARLYEDAGNDDGYRSGEAAWTPLLARRSPDGRSLTVEVGATRGGWDTMPAERGLVVRLPHSLPPESVEVDGVAIARRTDDAGPGWRYDGRQLQAVIRLPAAPVKRSRTVQVRFGEAPTGLLDAAAGILARLDAARTTLENLWPDDWPSDALVALSQTGRRIELEPGTAVEELLALKAELPARIAAMGDLKGSEAIKTKARAILVQR
jgi:hypothetical protein